MSATIERSVAGNQAVVLLVARILLGVIMLVGAYGKLMGLEGTTGYFAKLGIPAPAIMAPVVMIFEFIVGVMLIAGFKTRLAAIALALFCVASALIAHTNIADGNQLNHLLKNLAIAGGALALVVSGPGSMSVDRG